MGTLRGNSEGRMNKKRIPKRTSPAKVQINGPIAGRISGFFKISSEDLIKYKEIIKRELCGGDK